MQQVVVNDPQIFVLASAETPQGVANARGHLFEDFVSRLLFAYGFEEPQRRNLNVTSDGIELDIVAKHRLTRQRAVVECKAYTKPVAATALTSFYGKLAVERFEDPNLHGFFFALPKLTQQGHEKLSQIQLQDERFTYLDAIGVVDKVRELRLTLPRASTGQLYSDEAILITPDGIFEARKRLDRQTRTAEVIEVWARDGLVPDPAIELISNSSYASDIQVVDVGNAANSVDVIVQNEIDEEIVVEVRGSGSNFEYQLPAAPQYFIGRASVLDAFEETVGSGGGVLVLNAQSGWGKSSLALRMKQSVEERGGVALVIDSRTAGSPNFVSASLRKVAILAEQRGICELPENSSYASFASSLATIDSAVWLRNEAPLMVFFDQFENVFRNAELTSTFRNLALAARELSAPLTVGFAWKTDLVGWTEDHPYQLRDEIRSAAEVVQLPPLGAREVETLLRRLEAELGEKLSRDLRQRLREYSQGLPWLLKKFAGHLLRQAAAGVSQATLVEQALNVRGLFDADLAELDIAQSDALRSIARYAPVPAIEAMERIPAAVVQSLIDRRLIVQVGEQLDTYWDIFRDYVNTGQIPIQESYILRQGPKSVFRLLRNLMSTGGEVLISEAATSLSMTEKALANLSRELRLLGIATYASSRIRLVEEVQGSSDYEAAFRRRVSVALKRHRAFSLLEKLAERNGGRTTLDAFARQFPGVFPAVEASDGTWKHYAKVFATWVSYSGLAHFDGQMSIALFDDAHEGRLLDSDVVEPVFADPVFPMASAGPPLKLLIEICAGEIVARELTTKERKSLRELRVSGLVNIHPDGIARPVRVDLVKDDGSINSSGILEVISDYPGVRPALDLLQTSPNASLEEVGAVMKAAVRQPWSDATTRVTGKLMRSWARALNVYLERPPRRV